MSDFLLLNLKIEVGDLVVFTRFLIYESPNRICSVYYYYYNYYDYYYYYCCCCFVVVSFLRTLVMVPRFYPQSDQMFPHVLHRGCPLYGGCLVIIRKASQWTIVGNVLGKCDASFTLRTSFIDF